MLMATMILVLLAGLALAVALTTAASNREQRAFADELSARNAAEAGLNEALAILDRSQRAGFEAIEFPRSVGAASYSVQATFGEDDPDLDDDLAILVGTAVHGRAAQAIELVVQALPRTQFPYAAFSETDLRVGNNVLIDSYDSRLGSYAAQVPAGSGHARDAARIASNDDVRLRNARVYGDAFYGADADDGISLSPGAYLSGSYGPFAEPFALPVLEQPGIAPGPALLVDADTTLPPGTHSFERLSVRRDTTLTVRGPATLVVDDLEVAQRGALLVDATDGPVAIHVAGDLALRQGCTFSSTAASPADVSLWLTSDTSAGDSVNFKPNGSFCGTIVAPEARLTLFPGFEIFGALMAERIELEPGAVLHFDEALSAGVPPGIVGYERVSYRPRAVDAELAADLTGSNSSWQRAARSARSVSDGIRSPQQQDER